MSETTNETKLRTALERLLAPLKGGTTVAEAVNYADRVLAETAPPAPPEHPAIVAWRQSDHGPDAVLSVSVDYRRKCYLAGFKAGMMHAASDIEPVNSFTNPWNESRNAAVRQLREAAKQVPS